MTNHRSMTGPKARPTTEVPYRWMRKRTVRMTAAMGMTSSPAWGSMTSSPSIADITEIAGVMNESP